MELWMEIRDSLHNGQERGCAPADARQVKKAQVLEALAALVGGATGNLGMVGTGVLAASRTTSTSTLVNVRKLIPVRWMNLIRVNQLLQKNRVYIPDEDFDFVYDFLCQNCPNAAYRPIPRILKKVKTD